MESAAEPKSDLEDKFKDKPHITFWIKAIVGLFNVRKSIQGFVCKELDKQFEKIKNFNCSNCEEDILCKKCCKTLVGKTCCTREKICNSWDIARAAMNITKSDICPSANSTDVAGYLKTLLFCDFIEKDDRQIIKKVLDVRNELAHSPTFTLKKSEMEIMLRKMIVLVKSVTNYDHDALKTLENLMTGSYGIKECLSGFEDAQTEIIQIVKENSVLTLVSELKELPGIATESKNKFTNLLQKMFGTIENTVIRNAFENRIQQSDLETITHHPTTRSTARHNEDSSFKEECTVNYQVQALTSFSTTGSGSYNGEKVFTANGVLIKIYKKNILRLNVDAIVNSANSSLAHLGGVSYIISSAAGYELEKECQQFLDRNCPLPVTQSMTTTAGRLHYKGVIHTVGPCWSDYQDKQQCADDLAKSICGCITEADSKGFCSLAIPLISSGIFGVPMDVCVKMYVEGVKMYLKRRNGGGPVQEIHFVDIDVNKINYIQSEFTKQTTFFQPVDRYAKWPGHIQKSERLVKKYSTPKGKVKTEMAEGSQAKLGDRPRDKQGTNVKISGPKTEVVTSLKKVIACADINTTGLNDGVYLLNGHLMVTDLDRSKLLLFDDSVKLKAQYDVEKNPHGVCFSADRSLIFEIHDDGILVIYSLKEELREVSRFEVQKGTTGVGVSGDTIITGHKDNITMYNMEGKKQSSISKEGGDTYICVSEDGSRFYHKDGNHIVCHSVSDLSEIFRYSHHNLCYPCGIASDRHGNILVAGYYSDNIIMIDKDGTHDRVLVDKLQGIKYPSGVCCHPQRDEFVVLSYGLLGENVNAMEVYEMK